jgi:hypothetical protein
MCCLATSGGLVALVKRISLPDRKFVLGIFGETRQGSYRTGFFHSVPARPYDRFYAYLSDFHLVRAMVGARWNGVEEARPLPTLPTCPHVSENKFSVGERESASVKRACHGLGGAHGFILLVCRNLLYCSSGTRSLAARVDTLRIFSCALRTEEASPARCSARYCSASATVCRGESSGNERR